MIEDPLRPLIPRPCRILLRDLQCLRWPEPVLVYQMGKVGSRSVYHSLRRRGIKVLHFHRVKPRHIKALRKKRSVKIITLVRAPIARQMSDFFHNFERDTGMKPTDGDLNLKGLFDIFLGTERFWQPSKWFDYEMKQRFGVDVYDYPFPREKGHLVIKYQNLQIFVLKLELDDTVKEKAIGEFLDLDDFELMRANEGLGKEYAKIYRAFTQAIQLPDAYIDAMCNARYTKHFYSEVEIQAMRARWEGNTRI